MFFIPSQNPCRLFERGERGFEPNSGSSGSPLISGWSSATSGCIAFADTTDAVSSFSLIQAGLMRFCRRLRGRERDLERVAAFLSSSAVDDELNKLDAFLVINMASVQKH